jgi:hypothetical protein
MERAAKRPVTPEDLHSEAELARELRSILASILILAQLFVNLLTLYIVWNLK